MAKSVTVHILKNGVTLCGLIKLSSGDKWVGEQHVTDVGKPDIICAKCAESQLTAGEKVSATLRKLDTFSNPVRNVLGLTPHRKIEVSPEQRDYIISQARAEGWTLPEGKTRWQRPKSEAWGASAEHIERLRTTEPYEFAEILREALAMLGQSKEHRAAALDLITNPGVADLRVGLEELARVWDQIR